MSSRYTQAALERRALRRNADARKLSPRGVKFANYDSKSISEAREISDKLMSDWRWLNSSGTH